MRIFKDTFLAEFGGRILNLHPSLLPDYKGSGVYERIYSDMGGTNFDSGITIHRVSKEVDSGEIVLQARFSCDKEDSLEDFMNKGRLVEHDLYSQILNMIVSGELT